MNNLNKKIQLFIKQIIIFLCFTTLVNPQLKASINKENQIYEIIEKEFGIDTYSLLPESEEDS